MNEIYFYLGLDYFDLYLSEICESGFKFVFKFVVMILVKI